MVWFFKKKREPEFDYQGELLHIHENLKDSFLKIKQDIKIIKDWISHLNDRDNTRAKEVKIMTNHLDDLHERVNTIILTPSEEHLLLEETTPSAILEEPLTGEKNILDDLTTTQQAMFHRAGTMVKEAGHTWITIKALATDLYPGKEYDQVRSTTSEYVGILIDHGLLHKRRKGKQTYISLTKKGETFFKKETKKVAQKAMLKKRRNN